MIDKAISILGSTGSIGTQTLEVCDKHGIRVAAIAANSNVDMLEEQIRRYAPSLAAVFDERAAGELAVRVADTGTRVASGMSGLIEAAEVEAADIVVTAVVGTVGLRPTLAAIDAGKTIALANKETLVCAGELVMSRARERGVQILPVDSEHSAIFQCLSAQENKEFKRILLTASGGPFRGKSLEELERVTPEMALAHPNWSMGRKVTIDSATMMNKGLELIEAMHLFSAQPGMIKVIVHPQSIVHSMVEFRDNSVIAQLGVPDMRLPIQHALTYPVRMESPVAEVNFAEIGTLTFEEPDLDAFRCLRLAMDTAAIRGTACAVMNAANEAAVNLFLQGRLRFNGIYESVLHALESIENIKCPSVDDILSADMRARALIERNS